MEEILHHTWCRISSINSMIVRVELESGKNLTTGSPKTSVSFARYLPFIAFFWQFVVHSSNFSRSVKQRSIHRIFVSSEIARFRVWTRTPGATEVFRDGYRNIPYNENADNPMERMKLQRIVKQKLGGETSNIFIFHPRNWGRWTHFDKRMLQMGWFNHHLQNQR